MLAVEKGRNALVGARQLAHHIGAHRVAVLEGPGPRGGLQLVLDRVVVGEIGPRERPAIAGPEAADAWGVGLVRRAHTLPRTPAELRRVPPIVALDDSAAAPRR